MSIVTLFLLKKCLVKLNSLKCFVVGESVWNFTSKGALNKIVQTVITSEMSIEYLITLQFSYFVGVKRILLL